MGLCWPESNCGWLWWRDVLRVVSGHLLGFGNGNGNGYGNDWETSLVLHDEAFWAA